MEDQRLVQILDGIQKTQSETLVTVTEIKGDNKLQSQVLAHHIEQLKSFKIDMEKLIESMRFENEKLEQRIATLEKWQLRVVAVASAAAAIFTLIFSDIKEALFK